MHSDVAGLSEAIAFRIISRFGSIQCGGQKARLPARWNDSNLVLDFKKDQLCAKIRALTMPQQMAFLLLVCERMMPALRVFCAETRFDVLPSETYLRDGWSYLATGQASQYVDFDFDAIDAPDSDEFDHPLTYAALNAAVAAGCLASFLSAPDAQTVAEGAELAFETAFQYVQSTLNLDRVVIMPGQAKRKLQEWTAHPDVQRELERQAADVAFVGSLPASLAGNALNALRARAEACPPIVPPA